MAKKSVETIQARFEVTKDKASRGFRVVDGQTGQAVDGPFRDRSDAEARAAKREIRG